MERKRKLPARAAARLEQASKRRTATPPTEGNTTRSTTPAHSAVGGDDSPGEKPDSRSAHQLPRSIQPGKPLPTVEQAQPEDLPSTEYQSVNESGVLDESLARSRQKWINEGIFEKYWAKPSKRRGVAADDPKNPPKDSMVKLGQVVITVEPHIFEATMYGVKDPKPATPLPPGVRPIIMYGPSRGSMPPPPSPAATVAVATPPPPTPTKLPQSPAQTPTSVPGTPIQNAAHHIQPVLQAQQLHPTYPVQPSYPQAQQVQPPRQVAAQTAQQPPPVAIPPPPVPSPRGMEGILAPSTPPAPLAVPPTAGRPLVRPSPPLAVPSGLPIVPISAAAARQPAAQRPHAPSPSPPASTPKAAPAHPPGTDSIIVTLAERATEDPQLRDLMKRVANGNAPKDELDRFQAIIDQITVETKRNGASQGPSADRLFVDGRTVRFFAEEVRIILDIVLRSNAKQKSADLHPPAGSDPLVVLLVKTALDDVRVGDMVRRIGENRPQFSDATDLKAVLDKLRGQVAREKERERQRLQTAGPAVLAPAGGVARTNGAITTPASGAVTIANGYHAQQPHGSLAPVQQALRSKGPPPAPKLDVSAVVFEFAGGTGDRYLFPKFSILEYTAQSPTQGGGSGNGSPSGPVEVVASFLIVRKGSLSEYGGDPELDYYQPVTIRLQVSPQSSNQKLLDCLSRVVAPADEVRRYMDNIMSSMMRAEYVLLAMRLPRKEAASGDGAEDKMDLDSKHDKSDKHDKKHANNNSHARSSSSTKNGYVTVGQPQPMQGVLWTTAAAAVRSTATPPPKTGRRFMDEDQQYQNLIASVTPREVEEA